MQLYFVRHGETHFHPEWRYCGILDPPLNERGREQARAIAKFLAGSGIAAIYTSDRIRAVETAKIIGESIGSPVNILNELCELNFGIWEGMTYNEIMAQHSDLYNSWKENPFNIEIPKGESVQQLLNRVGRCVDYLLERHRNDTILAVTHAGPIRAILYQVAKGKHALTVKSGGSANNNFWNQKVNLGGISLMDFNKKETEIVFVNQTSHLAGNKVEQCISEIAPINPKLLDLTQKRLDNLTKPQGSLGRLEEIAKRIVAITEKESPNLAKKVIFTMAGDHGVVQEGVSAYPQEVTPQMVYNFLRGGAGINVLANHVGAKVKVIDMGVASDLEPHPELIAKKINYGTKNMANEPAMTAEEAVRSIEAGIEIFEEVYEKEGIDILGIGDMGIGNTTPSSAIVAVITGEPVGKVTGRGTGINDEALKRKIKIIEQAVRINKPNPKDVVDVLSKVGGFEIGGLAGATLAAAKHRVPVVADGFIATAGALLAYQLCPLVREYVFASHNSQEVGHKVMLNYMGLVPLLDLDLRLGEGTGAALAINIIEASVKILTQMATFGEAGVSEAV